MRSSSAFALAFALAVTALVALALAVLLAPAVACAQDDLQVAPGATPWSGWYAGFRLGWAGGTATTRPGAAAPSASSGFGALAGGGQLGWTRPLVPGLVAGLEADVGFPNFLEGDDRISSRPAPAGALEERLDVTGGLRARLGVPLGRGLLYGAGGLSWARSRFLLTPSSGEATEERSRWRGGWNAGAGIELPLARAWAARLEYRYDRLARVGADLGGLQPSSTVGLHAVSLGLSWRFGAGGGQPARGLDAIPAVPAVPAGGRTAIAEPPPVSPAEASSPEGEPRWNVHGQSTVVGQGDPGFHSPYQGQNSLSGRAQLRDTMSATAFVGVRAWAGGELYLNPELMQGFGLDDTHGVAAFPNGEAQRSNFPVPRFNLARIYLSQTFGLGGERERVEDGPNQLAGERDLSRVTVTAGKLAVTDFFLVNSYAGEPRTGFLNWNVYGGGSYDWTMDLLSWTWGALAELNQPRWALRAGYFLLPAVSNTNTFDLDVPRNGQWVAELEVRHALLGRPGKVQLFGWLSHGNIGSYPEALALAAATGGRPDVALTRGRDRYNGGVVVSIEQPVTDALGLFSRASWSPERGETMGWTDCGQSFSLGGVLKGDAWRRPLDAVGVAGLVEGLSPVARRYLAAGGMGTIIGDGALSYRPETVLETYYAFAASARTVVTLDHQLIVNPGYNAARGPVSVSSVRLHASF